jgi:hypothetical protein
MDIEFITLLQTDHLFRNSAVLLNYLSLVEVEAVLLDSVPAEAEAV